ncbi:MAG: hypothetical protein CMM47_10890 [Rhodospirillaceae bacterium]|nr:hypothetical protein [Rhodospirillaceae bacterium]
MVIKRKSVASAIQKLDEFLRLRENGWDNVIPGTTLRLEREFREERSPRMLSIYDGGQRIPGVTVD